MPTSTLRVVQVSDGGAADDPITEQLAQLAKILGPTAPIPEPFPAPKCAVTTDAATAANGSFSSSTPFPQKNATVAGKAAGAKDGPADANGESSATLRGSQQLQKADDGADGGGLDAVTGGMSGVAHSNSFAASGTNSDDKQKKLSHEAQQASTTTLPVLTTKTTTSPSTAAATNTSLSSREVPAPTNTISQPQDKSGREETQPPSQKIASCHATPAAAPTEREPKYRVEQLPHFPSENEGTGKNSRGDGGGCKEKHQKRAFVIIIDLPDLIESITHEETRELAGSKQERVGDGERDGSSRTAKSVGGSSSDSSSKKSRGGTGKGRQASMSDVELDVLPTVMQLRVPGKYQLRLDMPCVVDEESIIAKFNKSRAILKVSVQET